MQRSHAIARGVAALVSLGVGVWVYCANAPRHLDIVGVELGGSRPTWPLPNGTSTALHWDFVLIAGYGLALWFALTLARALTRTPRTKAVAAVATVFALTAVAADLAEDFSLLTASTKHSRWLDVATGAAVIKFSCVIPAAIVAVVALLVTLVRLIQNRRSRLNKREQVTLCPTLPLTSDDLPDFADAGPPKACLEGADRWRRGYRVPIGDNPVPPENVAAGDVGICLSGGGVRSASVALGALQKLRTPLKHARYLVSVSGGGYTAGALQLALTDAGDAVRKGDGQIVHDARHAFRPGSVEEDWVRRHADYLVDSPGGLVAALGIIARGLLLSIAFLFGPAFILGVASGQAMSAIQLANWTSIGGYPHSVHFSYPSVRTGTWWALALVGAIALFAYFGAVATSDPDASRRWRRAATAASAVTGAVAFVTIGVPSVTFGASWLLSRANSGVVSITAAASLGTVLLSYLVTIKTIAGSKVVKTDASAILKRGGTTVGAVPAGALQTALVVFTLTALAAAWLLLFGGMAAVATQPYVGLVALVGFVVFALSTFVVDQTSLSLHPFYRKQLARTFAVRRVCRPNGTTIAEGYDYDEVTTLSKYGARVAPAHGEPAFPEVIFAGTANLTGEQRAPLNGVPYTFSADWVGGPDVGYVRTADLESVAKPIVRRDVTVQAAVAISGAAFASAMGRAGRWYGTLLAVTGLRLGSWLPNPAFLGKWDAAARADDWTMPDLPSRRRLSYLVREVFGIHQYSDRLLQITDGGHYENLGLVELLRRRCTEIYCVDASGDTPPTAGTLEQAATLAHAELGVTIDFKSSVWHLIPGGSAPMEPAGPLTSLNARLSRTAIISADIHYPDESGLPQQERTGKLVFVKTLLTSDMEYELLSYAARNEVFPRDSTGDQFFDDGKFCAYRDLGRELGKEAARHRGDGS
jgi:hypothetical protein